MADLRPQTFNLDQFLGNLLRGPTGAPAAPALATPYGYDLDVINQTVKDKLRALVGTVTGTPEPIAGMNDQAEDFLRSEGLPIGQVDRSDERAGKSAFRAPSPYESFVQPVSEPILNGLRNVAGATLGETGPQQAQASTFAFMTPFEMPGGRAMNSQEGPLASLLKKIKGEGEYRLKDAPERRMEAALNEGAKRGADWSTGPQDLAKAIGPVSVPETAQHGPMIWTPDEAARHAAMLEGATSASTPVERNTAEMASTLAHLLGGGEFDWTNMRARGMGNVGSKLPNILRALIYDTPLTSDGWPEKTNKFGLLMAGHDGIPIDIHALDGVNAFEKSYPQARTALRQFFAEQEGRPWNMRYEGALNPGEIYQRTANAYRNSLKRILGGEYRGQGGYSFGQFWDGVRGLKPSTLSETTPIEWLRRNGLLEPGVLGTPEKVNEILRNQTQFPSMSLENAERNFQLHPITGTSKEALERMAGRDEVLEAQRAVRGQSPIVRR